MLMIATRLRLTVPIIACLLTSPIKAESESKLEKNLRNLDSNVSITGMKETPVPGILELEINGSQIVYASEDGNYVLTGQLMDISQGEADNLTEKSRRAIRAKLLSGVDTGSLITYEAEGAARAEIYIFTDVTCGYCKNFHKQIDSINESGITVHYLAFPRAGFNTPAGKLMETAWCSESPQEALTEIKASGKNTTNQITSCHTPIEEHYRMGISMGVNGTPYILTAEGRNLGGYLSKDELLSALD